MEDRRKHPRIEVMFTGTCNGATCQVKDISTSGMQFLATEPIEVGSAAEITIHVRLEVKWLEKAEENLYIHGAEKGVVKWVPGASADPPGPSAGVDYQAEA